MTFGIIFVKPNMYALPFLEGRKVIYVEANVCDKIFQMVEKSTTASIESLFRALSDRTRLRLVNLISDREVCVCYFTTVLALPQPTISRHLAYLRRAGLVSARREGKWMRYRILVPEDSFARQLLIETLRGLASDKDMQKDRKLLERASSAPQKFISLQGAPAPDFVRALAR